MTILVGVLLIPFLAAAAFFGLAVGLLLADALMRSGTPGRARLAATLSGIGGFLLLPLASFQPFLAGFQTDGSNVTFYGKDPVLVGWLIGGLFLGSLVLLVVRRPPA